MYIADLHIHSRFSRACSQALNVTNLAQWATLKGIDLLGAGDFLHPLWLSEIKSQLKEDGSGFLTLDGFPTKFVLTVEISSIYSHKGRTRRVHNIVFMPTLTAAGKFQKALLERRATLASDGRPIVGIPSKEILQLALQVDEKALLIPAHAWTPWFGIFGSESGYDSLEECFEDLTKYIYGVETGLSSDPAMNWRIKELDNRSIISSSDAHSLPNLGREATIFPSNLEAGYEGLRQGLTKNQLTGTVEFYPEEGKYHYTGHRNCQIRYSPKETKQKGTICPVCGQGLTVGVMERVEKLAARTPEELKIKNNSGIVTSEAFSGRAGYQMLVPLMQIVAEAMNSTTTSQKVINEYKKLVTVLGGEIGILTKVEAGEIAKVSNHKIAEGVIKARRGELTIEPGYDGVYGVVRIWGDKKEGGSPQIGLFE